MTFIKGHTPWNKQKSIIEKCLICGKKFKIRPCRKNQTKFCSHKCYWNSLKGKTGKDSHKWKGGKVIKENRWIISSPEHPFKTKMGYVFRSHLIAEKCLGRYLTPEEIIHHINNNSLDDRPKNLYLFPNQSKHAKFHRLKNKPQLKSNL